MSNTERTIQSGDLTQEEFEAEAVRDYRETEAAHLSEMREASPTKPAPTYERLNVDTAEWEPMTLAAITKRLAQYYEDAAEVIAALDEGQTISNPYASYRKAAAQ